MDNITHTLTGLALSQAGLNRKTRFATLALVVGANLPDVDLLSRLGGPLTYLRYHRGIAHSILGVTVLAALLAGALLYLGRKFPNAKKNVPPLHPRWLFAICWIATTSNLLLDFTNSYGVRPFLPFSDRWYAGDIMFIFDPLLLGLLILGLGIPWLLRLISEEVGAEKPPMRRGAIFALVGLVLLLGLRDLAHRRVVQLLDSRTYYQENPQQVAAFPTPTNPFSWIGVVETASAFHVLPVSALASEVNPERLRVFHKPEPSPALEAAMQTQTARIFDSFARFLWVRVEESEDGYTATLCDLRYATPDLGRPSFTAEIELNKNLTVRSESFSVSGQPPEH
jgi:inner membrane protein